MRIDDRGLRELISRLEGLDATAVPPLNPPPPSGTSDDMNPWQQSVEKRLDSLDARAQRLEGTASDIRTDVATLKERVAHLPTKEFIVKSTLGALAAVAALSAFVQWVLSVHPWK